MTNKDPRSSLSEQEHQGIQSIKHPEVRGAYRSQLGLYAGVFIIILAGIIMFNQLNSSRLAAQEQGAIEILSTQLSEAEKLASDANQRAEQTQAELELSQREMLALQSQPRADSSQKLERKSSPPPPRIPAEAALRAPALVVDNSLTTPESETAGAGTPAAAGSVSNFLNQQLASTTQPPARANKTIKRANMIPQGAILSGVLETAINSDLPGFTRAVVTHDVRSFDNSQVLIQRGSRLIGQYRSGLNLGEARVFVIWNRLIRPDGVSIDIASPATDILGETGLSGKVNNHYLKRFGGAVLLTIVDVAARDALGESDRSVILNQSSSVQNDIQRQHLSIPPTIEVAPGAEIRIMLSRDLYFPPNLVQ